MLQMDLRVYLASLNGDSVEVDIVDFQEIVVLEKFEACVHGLGVLRQNNWVCVLKLYRHVLQNVSGVSRLSRQDSDFDCCRDFLVVLSLRYPKTTSHVRENEEILVVRVSIVPCPLIKNFGRGLNFELGKKIHACFCKSVSRHFTRREAMVPSIVMKLLIPGLSPSVTL